MKSLRTVLAALLIAVTSIADAAESSRGALTLHYDRPATAWTEALPIGNGRLGAMVFGQPDEELLQLNEASLWSGGPVSTRVNPGAPEALAQVRAALAREDWAAGYALLRKMQGRYTESYMPLGDLRIRQDLKGGQVSGYHRSLDIRDGIQRTSFSVNGVRYEREVFASVPDQVIIVRLRASQPRQLSVDVQASSQLRGAVAAASGLLVLTGKAPSHVEPNYVRNHPEPVVWDDPAGCRGMRFELLTRPVLTDGTATSDGERISIRDATEVSCCRPPPVSTASTSARTAREGTHTPSPRTTCSVRPGAASMHCAPPTWRTSAACSTVFR